MAAARSSACGLTLAVLALATAGSSPAVAGSDGAAETFGLAAPPRAQVSKTAAQAPSARLRLDVAGAPLVALSPLDNRVLALEDTVRSDRGKALRFGVARPLAVT